MRVIILCSECGERPIGTPGRRPMIVQYVRGGPDDICCVCRKRLYDWRRTKRAEAVQYLIQTLVFKRLS